MVKPTMAKPGRKKSDGLNNLFEKTKNSELEALVAQAIKKVGAKDLNALRHYLPDRDGNYLHHFTFTRMVKEEPAQLAQLLKKHVIEKNHPTRCDPKQRAPRGSRATSTDVRIGPEARQKLLELAIAAGDKESVALLAAQSARTVIRSLINSIKAGRVEKNLWETYAAIATRGEISSPKALELMVR